MIPKIVHHIWVGSTLPLHLAACIDTWRDNHPGWEYCLWTETNLGWLKNRDLYDAAPSLVPRDAIGQFRADIARYEILRKHGGLYTDCDTTSLRPMDDLLEGRDAFAAAEDDNWVGNTYLACTPEHPVMQELVEGIPASVKKRRGKRPNWLTGPRYLTPVWQKHNAFVAEQRLFYPYSYSDVKNGTVPSDFGDAYAVHHWEHTRSVLQARKK